MKRMRFVLLQILLTTLATSAFAQDASYGPVNYTDKIIAQGNGYALASRAAGLTAFEVLKVTNNNTLSYKKQYPTGLTNLTTIWRGIAPASGGFVVAGIGQNPAAGNQWTLALLKASNKGGTQIWMRLHPFVNGGQLGEVISTSDGGYLVTGGNNLGQMFAVKFNSIGDLTWNFTYGSGFGWSAMNYPGGGYVIAGGLHIWKLTGAGILEYDQDIFLNNDPGGNPYTYGERERIINLQTPGFAVCGSGFSNSYSTTYYAKFDWNSGQTFSRVYEVQNTSLVNTPVNWVCNFVFKTQQTLVLTYIRINLGLANNGALRYQKIDLNGNPQGAAGNVGNPTPWYTGDYTVDNGMSTFGGQSRAGNWNVWNRPLITTPGTGDDAPPANTGSNIPPGYKLIWVHADGSPALRPYMASDLAIPKLVPVLPSNPVVGNAEIFPNPASGEAFVGGEFPDGGAVKIFSLDGKLAVEQRVELGQNDVRLDIARLERGVYLVQIQRGTELALAKLAVQ